MKKLSVLLISVMISLPAAAGQLFEGWEGDTRSFGMGGAFVALADDDSLAYVNPAGLGFCSGKARLGANHCELYGADIPLTKSMAAFYYPLPREAQGGIGIAWSSYNVRAAQAGYSYSENVYGCALGLKPLPKKLSMISVGIAGYFGVSKVLISSAGTVSAGFLDAGVVAELPGKLPLKIGALCSALMSTRVRGGWEAANDRDTLDRALRIGASLPLTFDRIRVVIAADYAGLLTDTQNFCAGVEVAPVNVFALRGGVASRAGGTFIFTGGATFKYKSLRVNYAYNYNADLGGSHAGEVGMIW